jgi:hypothetical protein
MTARYATLLLFLSACTSKSAGSSSLVTCNPFIGAERPIMLGTVLGAGRSASGEVYAADHVESGDRVFKSGDTRLIRRPLAGSGSGPDFYVFTVTDNDPPFTLQIDLGPNGPSAMGVFTGVLNAKTFQIGQQGEALELLPASALAQFTLQNLPPSVFLEYNAQTADGRFLVVVRPTDDWTYADFRLFFGPTDRVAERTVGSVTRALDGGSTIITFDVDGVSATASFPVISSGPMFEPGPASLTLGGSTQPLTRLPANASPLDHGYMCAQP